MKGGLLHGGSYYECFSGTAKPSSCFYAVVHLQLVEEAGLMIRVLFLVQLLLVLMEVQLLVQLQEHSILIILQNGNFNVASIANGGTGYVIVFATGNITFSNMYPTGTPPNVILISCGGDIISTAGAHPAFLATDWAIAATPGYIQVAGINSGFASYASSSPGFASPPTAVGGYLYYNGLASTSTYTIGSHDTSGLAG